ncbi:MAG: hypothetical protein AB7U05_18230 [Mangrovibacterium sp.]
MNSLQVNKSRMYQAVNKVLERNLALYAGINELVAAQGQLTNHLDLIGNYRQVQELNHSGLTNNKAMLKEQLINSVSKVVSGLLAFATATKDKVLLKRVNYKPYMLQKPDPVLADIARLILHEALPLQSDLEKYFVSGADLTQLETLIAQFVESIPQKRVALNFSKVSTRNIADVFMATDKLLKTEIDILMMPFQFTQPDFYNTYKNARLIVSYTGRRKIQDSTQSPAVPS